MPAIAFRQIVLELLYINGQGNPMTLFFVCVLFGKINIESNLPWSESLKIKKLAPTWSSFQIGWILQLEFPNTHISVGNRVFLLKICSLCGQWTDANNGKRNLTKLGPLECLTGRKSAELNLTCLL